MPGISWVIEQHEVSSDENPEAESIKLWLPSELDHHLCSAICHSSIVQMEIDLREGQCDDMLNKLHSQLPAKAHFLSFCNTNLHDQQQNTWALLTIEWLSDKVSASADKYCHVCHALLVLHGPGQWEFDLQVLNKSDVHAPGAFENEDNDMDFNDQHISKAQQVQHEWQLGEGHHVTSWLWMVPSVMGSEDDQSLNEGKPLFFQQTH